MPCIHSGYRRAPAANSCRSMRTIDMAGLEIDLTANTRNAEKISNASSRIDAFVIPTDEEQVIADEAFFVLKQE